MIGRLTFIAALLAAPMAVAQDAPPTAEQIAAARAEADRIIAAADAAGLFTNITGDARATVRHKASGMICTFFGDPEVDRILIFDDKVRGNDVGCSTRLNDYKMELTLYATRYEPMPTEQEALAGAVSAIRNRFPSARRFEGSVGEVGIGSEIRPLSESFLIDTTQGPMFTMAIVSHQNEWAFKARASGPEVHGTEISVAAGAGFYRMLLLRTLPD